MSKIYYYCDSSKSFYTPSVHGNSIPQGAIEISAEKHSELITGLSNGYTISIHDNCPVLIEPPAKSLEQRVAEIEKIRKELYADPQTGSDVLFAEAQRMQMMGESGWEAVRDKGIARYNEIKVEYPWPVE